MKDKIIFQLSKAEHRIKNYMKEKIKAQNIQISAGQSGVLFLLKQKNHLKMSELSRLLGIDNSAITRVIDRLEKNKLVKREMNPTDRRQYLIGITEKGKKDIEIVGEIATQTNEKIKEGFSEEEIGVFLKVLRAFETKF